MPSPLYTADTCTDIDAAIVMQFARLLKIQAAMLEREGDWESAVALRRQAESRLRSLHTRH